MPRHTYQIIDVLNLREKRSASSAVMIVCMPCRNGALKTLALKIHTTDKDAENSVDDFITKGIQIISLL